jgi:hypothetical protein
MTVTGRSLFVAGWAALAPPALGDDGGARDDEPGPNKRKAKMLRLYADKLRESSAPFLGSDRARHLEQRVAELGKGAPDRHSPRSTCRTGRSRRRSPPSTRRWRAPGSRAGARRSARSSTD